MNLLITGANGFVGSALCQRLAQSLPPNWQGGTIYGVCRTRDRYIQANLPDIVQPVVATLDELSNAPVLLSQVDCLVHLAARVHQMQDTARDPQAAFYQVNTAGTVALAKAAAQAGVKRFLYLSTVKVFGEGSARGVALTESSSPCPADPYGMSKWEAERQLRQLGEQTGLAVVMLRPPLVYGPGVKANFWQLLQLVDRGVPLPLARVNNARSLLFVGNLVDAILTCLESEAAVGETFVVDDGQPLSTPELIRAIAQSLQRSPRLLPVPPPVLRGVGRLTGKTAAVDRLLGSFVVDSEHIRQRLHWQPPFTLSAGLDITADWYRHLASK